MNMKIENKIWFGVIVGAVVVLIASIIYFVATQSDDKKSDTTSIRVVMEGDQVEYEYIAYVDRIGGTIFDTSREDIRNDPERNKITNFPEFSIWPSPCMVGVDMGPREYPVIDEYLMGLQAGDEHQFKISTENAMKYEEDMKFSIPVMEKIPLYQTMSKDEFMGLFQKENPIQGTVETHPFWKWQVMIEEVDDEGNVTLFHQPEPGFIVTSLPWECSVSDISSEDEMITLSHKTSNDLEDSVIEAFDYRYYNESFNSMAQMRGKGIITQMGPDVIIIDFNYEWAGREMWFDVTILNIEETG